MQGVRTRFGDKVERTCLRFAIRSKHRMTLAPAVGSRTTYNHQHQEDELRKEAIFPSFIITKTGSDDDVGNLEEKSQNFSIWHRDEGHCT